MICHAHFSADEPRESLSLALIIAFSLAIFPWINPVASGPSPAVIPLLASWLCAATAVLVFLGHVASRKKFIFIVSWSWLISGLVSCFLGLLQYFGASGELSSLVNTARFGEAFANLRQRNQFASLTNIALAALLLIAQHAYSPSCESKREPYLTCLLVMLAATVLAVGNSISSSRTGFFELLLLCVLSILWGQWRHKFVRSLLLWIVLVYGAAALAMPYLAGLDSAYGAFARMGKDEACSSRLVLWSNVLRLISEKPWLGWGWGELDYAHFITLYDAPRFCDILDNAHNLPLHLAVELGVPLALLVCGGFSWWVWRQRPWAERDATRQMAWAVMAVILLHSMLEYPLWYGPFQMAFGACLLLLWHQKQPLDAQNSSEKTSNRPLAPILCASAAIISIAFIAYAMWDYRRISQIYLQPEARDAYYRSDTLAKIRNSWLFADQVRFAELMITPLSPANAAWTFSTATALLHYSPESRVVEKLIESAVMLGRDDEAITYLARYRAAFPKEHALWAKANAISIAPSDAKAN